MAAVCGAFGVYICHDLGCKDEEKIIKAFHGRYWEFATRNLRYLNMEMHFDLLQAKNNPK